MSKSASQSRIPTHGTTRFGCLNISLLKKLIATDHPEKLKEFEQAFEPLRTSPNFRIREYASVFDEATLEGIHKEIRSIRPTETELHELKNFRRFIVHNHPLMNELQQTLIELVSEGAGEPVEPCYNFLSLYRAGGNCQVHMDAPEAKWTLDVCIEHSDPWPIYFSPVVPWPEHYSQPPGDWEQQIKSASDLQFSSHTMQQGKGLLFSGSSQWHYRDQPPTTGSTPFCNLIFFHFTPAGMREIVRPENWARLFNIPELAVL